MSAQRRKSHEILREHWDAKRARNPRLSLRGMAKRLSLSPPYLSKVLAGKKALPMNRVPAFAQQLGLDPASVRSLERAILREKEISPDALANLELNVEPRGAKEQGNALPSEAFSLMQSQTALDEWYYLPILEYVTCAGFRPELISQRLGLRPEVAARAWQRLLELGWVVQEAGQWKKVQKKIRFPAKGIDPVVQGLHRKMLERASRELEHHRTAEDFRRRLILGATVATTEENFRKAERYLEEAVFYAAKLLSEGPADRVYYLALQLFPLSRESTENKTSRGTAGPESKIT